MFKRKPAALLAAIGILGCLGQPAFAAEVDCGSVYCFRQEDFSQEEALRGICVTAVPQGQLQLGTRQVLPGDILTAGQLEAMTFAPGLTEADISAQLRYLPVYEDRVGPEAVVTLSVRGRENKAPAAEDFALETYRDLPLEGKLKAADPEGEPMTFQLVRRPKRGALELRGDGTFTYTPKKHKVGVDSFVYTATDASGKVSREATVTVNILKDASPQYTDTAGLSCRFEAEWLKNTGIFVGETLDGNPCFRPDRQVTRGEFTAMLVKALDLKTEEGTHYSLYSDTVPTWLQPYVAAAVRCGITAGLPDRETFGADQTITGAEAAVMLQNALGLTARDVAAAEEDAAAPWANYALEAMSQSGMPLTADAPLTRAEAAKILYRASKMVTDQTRFLTLEQ